MIDIFSWESTITLLQAVEKIEQPFNFLAETFFPKKNFLETDYAALEYRKTNRNVAPYIVANTGGVNIARGTSKSKMFTAPNFAARRTIGLADLKLRQFGETPNIYNAVKVEERLARLESQDFAELTRLIQNRHGVMASEILQTGVLNLRAYADDGRRVSTETIDFECADNFVTPTVHWSNTAAKIYQDLYTVSEKIQMETGQIPTVAICGKNIERYLLQNEEIKNWLLIPNRQNLAMVDFAPRFTSPNARYIGRISALNLDFYSYNETYFDEDGNVKSFVDDNNVIIGIAGTGSTCYFPITLFFADGQPHTISSEIVPQYTFNQDAQTRSLTLYSRFIQIPSTFSDWVCIKTCG